MSNNKQENTLEKLLEQYYTSPSPRKSFVTDLEKRLLNESEQDAGKSSWYHIGNYFRPSYMVAFVVTTIILISLLIIGPGQVQAAIEKLVGYIPGFGLVQSDSSIRIIPAPASQTKDGVSITIKQAVLSSDKTGIVFMIQGISPEAIAGDSIAAQKAACQVSPLIKLPDGRELSLIGNGTFGYDTDNNYLESIFYPPLTKDIDQVTFIMTCIPGTVSGKAPENWEIPLKFVAAGPGVTTIPVEMVITTPKVITTSLPQADQPMTLDKVIQTNDGYIFIGEFQPIRPNSYIAEDSQYYVPTIVDAAGEPVSYNIPIDLLQNNDRSGTFHWAYQIQTKDVNWPITIQFDRVGLTCSDGQAKLELDNGSDAVKEKIWNINKDFKIGACTFKITTAKRTQAGYTFLVTGVDTEIRDLNIDIESYPASKVSRRNFSGHEEYGLIYDKEAPKGKINVIISGVTVNVSGPWRVTWKP